MNNQKKRKHILLTYLDPPNTRLRLIVKIVSSDFKTCDVWNFEACCIRHTHYISYISLK